MTKMSRSCQKKKSCLLVKSLSDPKMGTAPRMTVAENLLLAQRRGQKGICICANYKHKKMFITNYVKKWATGSRTTFGYTNRKFIWWATPSIESFDGNDPDPQNCLLLDEHTAALDPKTSKQLMQITADRVEQQQS